MSQQKPNNHRETIEHQETVLRMADSSGMPASQYCMSMISNIQGAIALCEMDLANNILNDLKLIIDKRLAKKDPQGRHE